MERGKEKRRKEEVICGVCGGVEGEKESWKDKGTLGCGARDKRGWRGERDGRRGSRAYGWRGGRRKEGMKVGAMEEERAKERGNRQLERAMEG